MADRVADANLKVVDPETAIKLLPAGDAVPVLVPWLQNEHGIVFAEASFERARLEAALRDRPVYWSRAPLCWDGYRICFQYGGETIYVRTAKSMFH